MDMDWKTKIRVKNLNKCAELSYLNGLNIIHLKYKISDFEFGYFLSSSIQNIEHKILIQLVIFTVKNFVNESYKDI